MHKARLAQLLILFAAAGLWPQQAPAPIQDFDTLPPAVRDPHSTAADLAVPLCPATFNDSLETDGVVSKGDKTVTPPKAKHMANAKFSPEARRQKEIKHFEAIVSMVVDADGKPQNVCLMQSAGYGLDAEAAEAVQQYRFAPATKEGKPVAARIHVQVDFRLH
jgi:TonB family protein